MEKKILISGLGHFEQEGVYQLPLSSKRRKIQLVQGYSGNVLSPLIAVLQYSGDFCELVSSGDVKGWFQTSESQVVRVGQESLHTLNVTSVYSIVYGEPTIAVH